MEFKNANELLALCEEKNLPVSEIMRIREIEFGETTSEIVNKKMTRVLEIMKDAAFSPIRQPIKSMGGLIGGEARKLSLHAQEKRGLCGELLQKAVTYATVSYTHLPDKWHSHSLYLRSAGAPLYQKAGQ